MPGKSTARLGVGDATRQQHQQRALLSLPGKSTARLGVGDAERQQHQERELLSVAREVNSASGCRRRRKAAASVARVAHSASGCRRRRKAAASVKGAAVSCQRSPQRVWLSYHISLQRLRKLQQRELALLTESLKGFVGDDAVQQSSLGLCRQCSS